MSFCLSQSLDSESISQDLKRQGYVRIPDVLPAENAQRIYRSLLGETHWNLVFTDRGQHVDLLAAQLETMGAQKILQLQQAVYAQAQHDFQYCYQNYPIFDAYKAGINKAHVLHKFYEWLNSENFLDFARAATGADDISFADAQATRYKPGHFLTTHDDSHEGKNRRAAYIFNFTPDWSADWGGYLQLLDEQDDIRFGLKPSFNTLNILAVPQKHCVSIVAPFAGGMCMSISGWLRYGDPE